jgi:hypothetical protein
MSYDINQTVMLQYQIDAWKNDIFAESPRVKERYVDIDKYNKYKEIADKAYNEWDATSYIKLDIS